MAKETCFVIMPIGDQEFLGGSIKADDLKRRYDDLLKEALLSANPDLEIVRADEVAAGGAITSDIFARIMHSDHVVADITYPNPNVFYELGLRHACRPGTILLRERNGPPVPFDVAHLRHIEYENTATGLKDLASRFRLYFQDRANYPDRPDNNFLELAKLTHYSFPEYADRASADDLQTDAFVAMLQAPEILQLLMRSGSGEQIDQGEILLAMGKHPEIAKILIQSLVKTGQVTWGNRAPQPLPEPRPHSNPPTRQARRSLGRGN
jgi:hypothetical protein